MYTTTQLFDLEHTMAKDYLISYGYPWQALKGIRDLILELGEKLGEDYAQVSPQVWVHKTTVVAPTAFLGEPCIFGAGTEVRH